MGVVSEMADRVAVMQAGRIVEASDAATLFRAPRQSYTRTLLAAVPRLGAYAGTDGPSRSRASLAAAPDLSARFDKFSVGGMEPTPISPMLSLSKHAETFDLLTGISPQGQAGGRRAANSVPHDTRIDTAEKTAITAPKPILDKSPILSVNDLSVSYARLGGWFGRAAAVPLIVDSIAFELRRGETLGLVGESGSGKTTIGKAVLGLLPFTGEVTLDGRSVGTASKVEMKALRRSAQMIFQDPYASLDPRMSIGTLIEEPLIIHRIGTSTERRNKLAALLEQVRLPPDILGRYPHELSGGQRQRVCIARALALEPKLIIADESVAALDVSVRAQVLDLMLDLQERLGLAYLFISHDMAVIERMSHHVAVLQQGRIVELGTRRAVFETPANPYTKALMAAVPRVLGQ
jgi:ABC-type glutathione transport system ATPase component